VTFGKQIMGSDSPHWLSDSNSGGVDGFPNVVPENETADDDGSLLRSARRDAGDKALAN